MGKPPPTRFFNDAESNDDDPGSYSGDGMSSGESVSSNAPALPKRQRTSGITTRSSARIPTRDINADDSLNPAPSAITATSQLIPATPGVITPDPADGVSANPLAMSITSPGLQSAGVSVSNADMGWTSSEDVPHVSSKPTTDSDIIPHVEIEVACDTNTPPTTNPKISPASDAGVATTSVVEVTIDITTTGVIEVIADTTTNPAIVARSAESTPAAAAATDPPLPLVSSNDLDAVSIPDFLLRHATGKREVNIFSYLTKVKDPHFQQLLLLYIRFEASDQSGMGQSLPTANRPAEIPLWTGRARPAALPDYTKGGRTFSDFVDSVFIWWGSLQPSWRSFKRGKVSHEVRGGWETLHAPRINGLLNVVILVYWWGRILEEEKPEDGTRAKYEEFADDVAWVLSHLSA